MKAFYLLFSLAVVFVFCEEEEYSGDDSDESGSSEEDDDHHSSKQMCPTAYKRISGACVYIQGPARDFSIARQLCANNGGRIMRIKSAAQLDAIGRLRPNLIAGSPYAGAFIDGRRVGGTFFNLDGTIFSKNLWARGQPAFGSNGGSGEQCAEIRFGQRGAFETPCAKTYYNYVICQANTDFLPRSQYINCPAGFLQFGEKCFRFIRNIIGEMEGRIGCIRVGGRLATIRSKEDLKAVSDLVSFEQGPHPERAYVDGFQSTNNSVIYLNHDGTAVPADLWCVGEPNNLTKQRCVAFWIPLRRGLDSCYCKHDKAISAVCMAEMKIRRPKNVIQTTGENAKNETKPDEEESKET